MASNDPDRAKNMRQAGMLTMIPTLMVVSPLVGYFLGVLLQRYLGAGDWIKPACMLLGMAAGVRQMILILRKVSREQ
jgi:F0F1-type ATP synthase assembly protein I